MGTFGLGANDVSSLVTLYLGAVAVALPVGGSIGDRFGHRRAFLLGVLAFAAASALAAVATTFEVLEVSRVGQAASGALISTSSAALVRQTVAGRISRARPSGCSTSSSRRARRSARSSAACSSARSGGGRCSCWPCRWASFAALFVGLRAPAGRRRPRCPRPRAAAASTCPASCSSRRRSSPSSSRSVAARSSSWRRSPSCRCSRSSSSSSSGRDHPAVDPRLLAHRPFAAALARRLRLDRDPPRQLHPRPARDGGAAAARARR